MKKELQIEKPNMTDLKKPKNVKEKPADVELKDAKKSDDKTEEPPKDSDLLTLEGDLLVMYCLSFFVLC